jgi:hypothetical protein
MLIAYSFQNYFLSTAAKLISNINTNEELEDNNCIDYLYRVFNNPFTNIIFNNMTTRGIKEIIKSLKSGNTHGYDEISVKILKKKFSLYHHSFELYL